MKKLLDNQTYIKTATDSVLLYYLRSKMTIGERIIRFKTNKNLIDGLKNCDTVVFSMYWKPLGDSFLFLSVATACIEFLKIIRGENMPKLVVDDKFSSLVRHAPKFRHAAFVKNGVDLFKSAIKSGKKAVLITDDVPFTMAENPPVFNSENYQYPKFYEILEDGKTKEYASRPARYFLTFEREVGIRLAPDPNDSLPDFVMRKNKRLQKLCLEKFKFDPDSKAPFFAIVSVASMVQKKFGLLRYLKIAEKLLADRPNAVALVLANSKEESPKEWLTFEKSMKILGRKTILINSDDFELLAYIFARCKFVLGNDTGFSHLAAMSRSSLSSPRAPTIIIYSRHDYRKWSTGKTNVFPITTELSRYLSDNNMSISRDKIDVTNWGIKEWAYSISPDLVYKTILKIWKK